MVVKNKKKKKDEKLAKRSWLDAYGSIAPGLTEISGKVVDMDNPLNRNLQIILESGLVGLFAEHLKNRRDAKATAQWTAENPIGDQTPDRAKEIAARRKEAAAMGMDPDKPFLSEWNTDMGIKDTAKVIPGSGTVLPQSNQAKVDTVFQGAKEANYTGNTNLFGGMPKISTPNVDLGKLASADIPGLTAKNLAASGGDLGKLVTQNPQISAVDLAKAQLPQGATGLSNIPSTGAGAATAGITPGAVLGIASTVANLIGGSKKQTYGSTAQPQNPMGQGGKEDEWLTPNQQVQIASHRPQMDKRRRYHNPYMA